MANRLYNSNLLDAFLGAVSPEVHALPAMLDMFDFPFTEAEETELDAFMADLEANAKLQVFGLHEGNDLFLHFDARKPLDALRRASSPCCGYAWYTAEKLLSTVKELAEQPGGIRHVVSPTDPDDWWFAHDFNAQMADNVFRQAQAHESANLECQKRMRGCLTDAPH